mmetsp:Transcript_21614/g.31349  ORF Transcript_21614/g.31349 Transcript_21614/m.31349 type:complete len:188 (-) Transcript_21614:27-590(-)
MTAQRNCSSSQRGGRKSRASVLRPYPGRKVHSVIKCASERENSIKEKIKKGYCVKLKTDRSQTQGTGLFVMEDVLQGHLMFEFVGECITQKCGISREKWYGISSRMLYFTFKGRDLCVDATNCQYGKYTYLNHSRTLQNCFPRVINIGGSPRIFFFACTDLKKGMELFFDYGERRDTIVSRRQWLAS